MKYLPFQLIAIALSLLSSCIDGEEELHIRADKSASMKLVYKMPSIAFTKTRRQQLADTLTRKFEQNKSVKLVTNQIKTNKGLTTITIKLETDDIKNFRHMIKSPDPCHPGEPNKASSMMRTMMGEFTIEKEGLSANVTRTIDITPILKRYGIRQDLLGDSEIRYTIHLPVAANQTNANQIHNNGKTLKWAFKLREHVNQPMLMKIKAPVPTPWWAYGTLGCATLIIIWLIWKFLYPKILRR